MDSGMSLSASVLEMVKSKLFSIVVSTILALVLVHFRVNSLYVV